MLIWLPLPALSCGLWQGFVSAQLIPDATSLRGCRFIVSSTTTPIMMPLKTTTSCLEGGVHDIYKPLN